MQIRVDYEQLETIARQFAQLGENHDELYERLVKQIEALHAGGWIGEGANAFYREMDELVLPATCGIVDALLETRATLMQVIRTFQDTEDDAAQIFLNDSDNEASTHTPSSGVNTPSPESSQNNASGDFYTIRSGDTLWGIGQRYGVSVDALVSANNIADRNRIYPGQQLIIPSGTVPANTQTIPGQGSNPGQFTGTEAWASLVGKTSNRNLGWGCVAHVLSRTYVPWTEYTSPGNAKDWLQRAQDHKVRHPEHQVTINQTPRVGSIAVFPNQGNGYGHIGYVTNANGNSFTFESANTWYAGNGVAQGHWFDSHGNVDKVDIYTGQVSSSGYNEVRFIHFPWAEVGTL